MPDLAAACRLALMECLGVRAGETVLVVTDTEMQPIGDAFLRPPGSYKLKWLLSP